MMHINIIVHVNIGLGLQANVIRTDDRKSNSNQLSPFSALEKKVVKIRKLLSSRDLFNFV